MAFLLAIVALAAPARAQDQNGPYEQKLMRLSEVLGAMHHLRNVCGANEGQLWREQMIRLLDAEAPSPARRARLVRQFNKGYQTYQRSYQTCTDSASLEATKFATEGATLAQSLAFERANY
jgi:uncharacterized protein (TIGR02301 family)